ncbi:hypothetical protein, conserved [Babesia bigemina]|uniref:Zinc finger ZPR1-type domain-containing protein n=1 Tax=Babesia bigemina TaxID=5866 RepID=A0A061DAM3_BABBI|nr:hypothetical protein, conserved [Babesia bigemina]CDR95954.1 hypothetical protein, conserved [Babesia bigemina]|eukprot:XP_012768140.1 hypothetical protein, conserved [Babesia bigemina]
MTEEESRISAAEAAPDAENDAGDAAVVESVCLNCGENGTTRLLLTKIPHFRDVILMSFECGSCGYRDNELQDAAPLQNHGVKITAKMLSPEFLNNQMVLSGHASCRIEELDFEIQPSGQKGYVTTVEGYLSKVSNSLEEHVRSVAEAMANDPNLSIQLSTGEVKTGAEYIHTLATLRERLNDCSEGAEAFTLILDDPSGNSYIEDTDAVELARETYARSEEQQQNMGYAVKDDFRKEIDLTTPMENTDDVGKEGVSLPVDCPHCGSEGLNKICEVCKCIELTWKTCSVVPGFGPCVIMAFTCETCGAKSNEMKPGGGYKDHARRWTLTVQSVDDLNRDVIISETAAVRVNHLDVEMSPGTIGAAFTTVEGLIGKLVESLEKAYPFVLGDSATEEHAPLREKVRELQALVAGDAAFPFTLVIDDPADHSFIGARRQAQGDDANLVSETYERTQEQNDELGLTDMKTEDY